jgi:hypothetical protein
MLRRGGVGEGRANAVHPYRPGDVLDLLLAQILEGEVELVAHLLVRRAAEADAAGLGQGFQPRREIDPVAEDVAVVEDDVAEVDPDAELDAPGGRDIGVAFGHAVLDFDRAAHRVDDAAKLHQQAVAGGLDDAAMVLGDLRVAQLAPDRLQRGERAFLVRPHQPRPAGDIGGEDRHEAACRDHAVLPIDSRCSARSGFILGTPPQNTA